MIAPPTLTKEDPGWIDAVGQGWIHKRLLESGTSLESQHTNYDTMAESGWYTYQGTMFVDVELRGILSDLQKLGVDISKEAGDYVEHRALHSNDFHITYPSVRDLEPKKIRQEASHAFYYSSVDASRGVVFANHMQSPAFKIKRGREQAARYNGEHWNPDVPPLNKWSDIVFLQWKKSAGSELKRLKVIFHHIVANRETDNILRQVVGENWGGTPFSVTPREDDKENFYAILGTPHGKATCYLLEQHARDLGRKTVARAILMQSRALRLDGSKWFHLVMLLEELRD